MMNIKVVVAKVVVLMIVAILIWWAGVSIAAYEGSDYLELLPSRQGDACPFESCKELWDKREDGRCCWGIDNDGLIEEDTLIHVYERDIRTLIRARLENNCKPVFRREIHVSSGITITKLSWIPPGEKNGN